MMSWCARMLNPSMEEATKQWPLYNMIKDLLKPLHG
jgi:hypothetical protein